MYFTSKNGKFGPVLYSTSEVIEFHEKGFIVYQPVYGLTRYQVRKLFESNKLLEVEFRNNVPYMGGRPLEKPPIVNKKKVTRRPSFYFKDKSHVNPTTSDNTSPISDNIHGMISSVRIQYVLDRYLKKVKLPKYRDATVSKEQDIKEFKEILNLGYFTAGDLAQYYIIRKGKIPPALNPDFESLVYTIGSTFKGKSPQKKQKVSSPRASGSSSKINLDNQVEFEAYFEALEAQEKKNKNLSKDLVNQGYATPSKITKKYLDTIKKNIKKEIENIVKDSQKEFKSNEFTKTMYRREMDAKNYDNDVYKKSYFKRGTQQGLTKEEKLASQIIKLSVKPKKSLPVTADEIEKIRKLVKGIALEEKQLKAKKTIRPNSPVKRKRSASISTAGSSKASSPRLSIKSATSSKGSIVGYDSD
jgi:hypothetical protein